MAGILSTCVFVIDQYIPLRKKVELIRMIKSNGGASVYSVSEKSTHLITSQEGFNEPSAKVTAATLQGCFIVSKEFVVDSITQGIKLSESNYFFTPGALPTSPTSSPTTTPTSPPVLSVSIPSRPTANSNSPQQPQLSSSSSPRSPPGFINNNRAPSSTTTSLQVKKGGFGGLRVDVNSKGTNSPQASPISPKSPYSNSSSGIAGSEEEEDDEDEDDDDSSDEDEPGKPSFKDVLEQSNKQPRAWEAATPQYGAEDDGCKIFVGGIMFDDLEALKKTKDGYSASEEVIAHIQKLKNERLIEIIRIFSRFGTVVRVKQFLEKRHIFITYDNKQSALAALRTLKPLEVRKKIVQEVRERLRGEDRQTLVSPRSNFYVRWPHHVESEREDGGYSSASHSYFSGSSAPSSPTGLSQPSSKPNWRQQPSSPTGNYQPYQRSYFTNNFNNPSRSTSMRTYSRNSESDYENSNNPNSFSENESTQYSRQRNTQLYQHPHRTPDITPPKPAILSESDSDSSTGIRHRVVDRSIDRGLQAETPASTSSSSTAANSTSPSSLSQPASASQPVATSALLNPAPSARAASPSYTQQKRRAVNEEGNWHKVLVLLLVLAVMVIVYLYNK